MTFHREGPLGVITLNRPEVMNAQGYRMLDEIDQAFDLARADAGVRVVHRARLRGRVLDRARPRHREGRTTGATGRQAWIETYDQFKKYNLDLLLKWRNFPKPTIAMVEGYCIYAGWMLAAVMDVVFAAEGRVPGRVRRVQLDPLGPRLPPGQGDLLREPLHHRRGGRRRTGSSTGSSPRRTWSGRPSPTPAGWPRTSPFTLRMSKLQMNKAQDAQGFTSRCWRTASATTWP